MNPKIDQFVIENIKNKVSSIDIKNKLHELYGLTNSQSSSYIKRIRKQLGLSHTVFHERIDDDDEITYKPIHRKQKFIEEE